MKKKHYVGFGFGPIQSGLLLLEAYSSGNFDQYSVAEIDAGLVEQVNGNGGCYVVNVALATEIKAVRVSGVRMLNPRQAEDRKQLVQAIREADELGTALPSVKFYAGDAASVVTLLTEALQGQGGARPQIIYTAENDTHAAVKLTGHLREKLSEVDLRSFQAIDTVIGKMSGVITDADEIKKLGLMPMTPKSGKAVLVEAFNRILIEKVRLPGVKHGIEVFEEKSDLMPFEEAKLYGHNATHALIGYLVHERGLSTMAHAAGHDDVMTLARKAFLQEAGTALCRKYGGLGDALFTPAGFAKYVDDLLARMVNPYLNDRVDRVIRDPQRKLSWSDRLYGSMRLCLQQGVEPGCMAKGAAAGVRFLLGREPRDRNELAETLRKLWGTAAEKDVADKLIEWTWRGR